MKARCRRTLLTLILITATVSRRWSTTNVGASALPVGYVSKPVVAATKGRRKNREATERSLIEACGRLLLRDGADGIGVNNVVAEAGVGKDLIYRYFGGLPGLIRAWLEQEDNWPTTEELIGGDTETFAALALNEKLKTVWRNYMQALRARPVVMRIMASELMHPTDITTVLDDAGDRIGRSLADIMSDIDESDRNDVIDLSFVCYTMVNYLCLRATTSPDVFGHDFTQDENWRYAENIIDELSDRYLD
jgi:AcrR family transcriptional regulator